MKARARLRLLGLALGLMVPGATAFAQTTVSLTFDDGLSYDSNYPPILDSYGMKGTFYIISGVLGTDPSYYMSVAQVQAIYADGHEIGGHTITHPDLTTLTAAQQQHEICDGRTQLIGMGFSPVSFAYPEGAATTTTESIVKSCYTSGRGAWCNNDLTNGACNETIPPGDPYWIQTPEAVVNTTTLVTLENYVTYAPSGGWVLLQFHFVCPDTDTGCNQEEYSIKQSVFTAFLSWLHGQVNSGAVVVKTVGQVMGGAPGNPIPAIAGLSPSSATVGGSAFNLTVTGSNFISSSTVQWNGAARTTAFVSSTTLTALIPAGDLSTVKIASVTVYNPAPGGGTSSIRSFTVGNPAPILAAIAPSSTTAGSPAFTLTVSGSNWVNTSSVRWNGSARTTTFISSTTLTAQIPASDLTAVKIATVTVLNPAPGGGTSTGQIFTINPAPPPPNPTPTLTSISPSTATAGGPGFTLRLTGTGFISTSTAQWNGSARVTTYVSRTSLTAVITALDLVSSGTANVTVFNPAPGGGTSGVQAFTITPPPPPPNPAPVLSSLIPSSATVGGSSFTLTLNGSNFISSSVVRWNGNARTTFFASSTTLTAAIPASDIAGAGSATVTVFNPSPGGGTSSGQTFTINASTSSGPGPWTIWGNTAPAVGQGWKDPSALEIGVRFRSDIAGYITGIRFYKWSFSTGTHSGHLWTNTGALLASITFTGETASGWQTAYFATPVAIAANTTYVASYFTTTGYAVTTNYFTVGVDNAPLHALKTGVDGLNGVYLISKTSAFPTQSTTSSNYWVDVVFNTSPTHMANSLADQPPPVIGGEASLFADFSQMREYPNPWRVDRHRGKDITFDRLPLNSTVQIYTLSAHWVKTLDASSGTALWDLTNDAGEAVASGYYIYLVTHSQGKSRGTLAIIR